jgi:hypothetical protein
MNLLNPNLTFLTLAYPTKKFLLAKQYFSRYHHLGSESILLCNEEL